MKVYGYRKDANNQDVLQEIYDIHEATYSGKDMGERKIDATIENPDVIDFKVGDYIELQIADLRGGNVFEKFYIQNPPSIKKVASKNSVMDAFEHTVTFYPAQYELGITQMRDVVQEVANPSPSTAKNIIYTGYDEFSFFGGAHLLMRRIIYVMNARYKNVSGIGEGNPEGISEQEAETATGWNYVLSPAVDEELNNAIESVQFNFSGNSVLEALNKLNEEGGLNIDFFINNRIIYVGYKRPHIMQLDDSNQPTTEVFNFEYGKTSHLKGVPNSGYQQKGGLYDITKTIGTKSPITRLYAYGANRNLNRFYCADRIRKGRYVNQLMLPSFLNDGVTDYIESEDGIKKFGVREATKRWNDIYPTIKNVTYATLRGIKYCFRIENSGLDGETGDFTSSIATIRCYQVVEIETGDNKGVNKLVPSYPPVPVAVFVHATGKTVKCVMWTSYEEQMAHDGNHNMPEDSNGSPIPASCFCVHHLYINDDIESGNVPESGIGYAEPEHTGDYVCVTRSVWFTNLDQYQLPEEQETEVNLHQIQYTDDYWGNDLFVLTKKENSNEYEFDEQTEFTRDGMSFGCYPMLSENYEHIEGNQTVKSSDNTLINEIVDVQPITKVDTDINIDLDPPSHFYIYLRDIGFKINQQAYSGQYNWLVQGEFKISFLDGYMGGLEFTVTADNGSGDNIVPAYFENGDPNPEFLHPSYDGEVDTTIAQRAKEAGACWRLKCVRNTDNEYAILPNNVLNPQKGDHIVFLNIYMPDIYILAAQERLLKEARKYLNDNDNGEISYAMTFDKIRLAQQPMLGIQLREGCQMRIVDDDLKIYTDNEQTLLYSNISGNKTVSRIIQSQPEPYYLVDNNYLTFNKERHYTVLLEVAGNADYNNLEHFVKLMSKIDGSGVEQNVEIEIDSIKDGKKRGDYTITKMLQVSFYTDNTFNTNYEYVLCFRFSDNDQRDNTVWLYTVRESNTNESGEVVKFVDLTVDQLTIKLNDSERSYDIPNNAPARRLAGGTHSNGSLTKEVTAVVKEKQHASGWDAMMNTIQETVIETEFNTKTAEQNAITARRNFKQLVSLRDNIFDPDGNVDEVFFRTMMLQNGADSMNYVLDKTYIYNGKMTNVQLTKDGGVWTFRVGFDTLRHYSITDGAQGGTWRLNSQTIPDEVSKEISNNVNYIAIKCSRSGNEGTWVISEVQHAYDEEPDYYYFNYGMISACEDTDTTRFITETRGNVFIYGDNVVLGKIATMDGSSYLDMMKGEFKLGEGLAYKNGYLVIGSGAQFGTTGGETVEQALNRITAAQNEASKTVGGENLYTGLPDFSIPYRDHIFLKVDTGVVVSTNVDYVVSVKSASVGGNSKIRIYAEKDSLSTLVAEIGGTLPLFATFKLTDSAYDGSVLKVTSNYQGSTTARVTGFMVQKGQKPTEFQSHVKYLTEAFENAARAGSTDIDGGLLMTSLLKLRNEEGVVTAGMSGLSGTQQTPENVLLWGGATYAEALYASTHDYDRGGSVGALIQTLLKKDGTGKIGVFYVEEDKVLIKTPNGIIAIDDDKGILMYRGTDLTVPPYVEIRPNAISADELPQYKDYTTSIVKTTDTPFPPGGSFRPNPYLPRFVEILTFTPLENNNKLTISGISIHIKFGTAGVAHLTSVSNFQFFDFDGDGSNDWGIKFTLEMRLDGRTISSFSVEKGAPTGIAGLNDTFTLPAITENVNGGNHKVSIYLDAHCTYRRAESDAYKVRIPQGTDVTYTLACTEFSLNNEYNKTLIGTNGILAAHNGNNYFFIDNSVDNKQKITIKGLPDVEHANAGQLYKDSNGYLKIR